MIRVNSGIGFLASAVLMLCICSAANATSTVSGHWVVDYVVNDDSAVGVTRLEVTGATQEEAMSSCLSRLPADQELTSREFGFVDHGCHNLRYVAREAFSANPTCGPAPEPRTQQAACPEGTTGTFEQSAAYVSNPYPTCWQPGTDWQPSTPPTTSCPPIPPPPPPTTLPAPTGLTAVGVTTRSIRVSWDAVDGASAYRLERCIGRSCTPFYFMCTALTMVIHGPFHSDGLYVTYRVRASKDSRCSTTADNMGPFTENVIGRALTSDTQAALQWTPPTQNSDGTALEDLSGYRVLYGRSPNELTSTIQLNNPATTAYTVGGLSAGTWYFGLKAFNTSGVESGVSNVVSKIIE